MPRTKLVYQEYGEWEPARSTIGVCKHPRDRLRFDGSFGTPSFMYCRDCGTRYLPIFHGWTEMEIAEAQAHALNQMIDWGWRDKQGNWIDRE
jgi:hypothetical protein